MRARQGSTDGQTVANQERELREVAEAKGWAVGEATRDSGISGAKARDGRPGLDKTLREAVQGHYDVFAAWSVDIGSGGASWIRRERRRGHGVLKIAREVGVGVSVVQRVLGTR